MGAGIGFTFGAWVVSLVFFRADSIGDAAAVFANLSTGWARIGDAEAFGYFLSRVRLELPMFVWCFVLIFGVEAVEWARRQPAWQSRFAALAPPLRWSVDYAVVFGAMLFGTWSRTPFVYFQF